MARHVAFVGPDLFSAYHDMVRGLKQVGARVSAIGHTPRSRLAPALKGRLDDYVQVQNLLDPQAVLDGARQLARSAPIDLIETGDEALVLLTAQVREKLGLPGLSVRSANLCRDKPAMKEALREAGIPCAASAPISSLAELHAFAEQHGYPLVIKPRSALGGLGTFKVTGAAELEAAAAKLKIDRGESAAVEEWIEGHEGFYDTLSIEGEVVHEFISHYYPNVLPALADRRISPQIAATNRVDAASYQELKDMGRKVVKVLGIGTSATHMEWFFGPKGLRFSEIGARPPGERIWDLYCWGNDFDLWLEWAMVLVHHRLGGRPSRRFATGSVQVRPEKDGHYQGYDGLKDVFARCRGMILAHHLPPKGKPTDPIYKGYLNNVWFRLRHPDYDELRRAMDYIGQRLKIFVA
jgi:formate-dependent phosphoribosylglycinamide formyltransferase (GAR transformylase)